MSPSADAVIVGAGLAGLAAAHKLSGLGIKALVVEQAAVPGGRARTEQWSGVAIELGAAMVTNDMTRAMALIENVGLTRELQPLENAVRMAVRRGARWHDVDYASALSPLRFSALGARDRLSLARGGLLSLLDSRHLSFGDLSSAASIDTRDAADVFRAATCGYYLSPIFESFYGYKPKDVSWAVVSANARFRSPPLRLRRGMGSFSSALALLVDVRYSTSVHQIRENSDGVILNATDEEGQPLTIRASSAILAVPANVALCLWPDAPTDVKGFLGTVQYSRADGVYMRTANTFAPRSRTGQPILGQVIPAAEQATGLLSYLEFLHRPNEADGGLILADARRASHAASMSDSELAAALQAEVEALHPQLKGQIIDRRVVRPDPLVPIFRTGYSRALAAFQNTHKPGVIDLAGDYLGAPWIEGAIVTGEAAARRAAARLQRRSGGS